MNSKVAIIKLMLTGLPIHPLHKEDPIEKYRFIHHFVPHPKRQHRATLLSHKALKFYILLVLLNFSFIKMLPKAVPGVLSYASNIKIQDLLVETNEVRDKAGLPALTINEALSKAAEEKAKHMFENDYWAHVAPDGTKPWDFIISAQYDYEYAGENLAKNFNTSQQVVNAWYDSESHRENLLNRHYTEIGFAVVNGELNGYETTLVVQMFGRPRNPQYLAEVPQASPEQNAVQAEPAVELNGNPQQLPAIGELEPLEQEARQGVLLDMPALSRYILLIFGTFFISMLSVDMWYSHRKGITKFTGHTFAHIIFLLFILTSVLLTLTPGRIL